MASIFLLVAGLPLNAKLIENKDMGDSLSKSHANRQLLVRYKDGATMSTKDELHFSVGAYPVKSFEIPHNLEVVEVAKGISLQAAQEMLAEDPNVLYVERNHKLRLFLTPPPVDPPEPPPVDGPAPIDPKYSEQWGLNNKGQTGGTADVDINGPELWDISQGDDSVIIGVIDTGTNYKHPDLQGRMWVNEGEIPGNGVDDDNNGVIDDIHGYNAVEKSGDPMDDHGHGSHCAGVIAAEPNNTHGGRGVLPKAKVIACRFITADGQGTTADAIECLEYFRKLKTREVNPVNIFATSNSWGGSEDSQALGDAIKAHEEEGILFIAAASNDYANNDLVTVYPANYRYSNVVSVAAIDHTGKKAAFSNYGAHTVHVGAPGVDILSTVLDNGYETMSGTSMATPFAAGLAGMIHAYFPDLNYMKVKNLLMAGGVPSTYLAGKTISGRRIRGADVNGLGSLTCKDQIVAARLSPSANRLAVPVGTAVRLSAISINCAEAYGDAVVVPLKGNSDLKLLDNGRGMDNGNGDGSYSAEWIAERTGRFEFKFPNNDIVTITVYEPRAWEEYLVTEAHEYSYRQIEGTPLAAEDDWNTAIELPFPIHFAGDAGGFDVLSINSNGALSFTDLGAPVSFMNSPFPAYGVSSLIAPYWDDLNPGELGNGEIFYDIIGEAPNRELVVEWRDVYRYGSNEGATFQVVFFEQGSDILFNYQDTELGDPSTSHGASATIGVQTTPEHFVQVGVDEAVLSAGKSVVLTTRPILDN